MEFEVLSHPDTPSNLLEAFRRYLLNPRRQIQAWGERAPVLLGVLILALVVVEFVLAHRVSAGLGNGPGAYGQAFLLGGGILAAEAVVIGAASSVAGLFEKAGRPGAAFAYLNLELTPLLLWLPVTMLARSLAWPDGVRLFVLVLLLVRVFSRWREVAQFTFKLSRLQTFIAVYGAITAGAAAIATLMYVAVLGGFVSLLSR